MSEGGSYKGGKEQPRNSPFLKNRKLNILFAIVFWSMPECISDFSYVSFVR